MPVALRREAIHFLLVSALLSTLTACGGGSSSSGSTTTNPNGEPPIPQSSYTGTRTLAAVDLETALPRTQDVFTALDFLSANAKQFQAGLEPASYTQTLKGTQSGTDTITGLINNDDGSGWVKQQYSDYAEAGSGNPVVNGAFIIFQNSKQGGVVSSGTLGFDHYTTTYSDGTVEYDGTIKYTFTLDGAYTFVANISVVAGSSQAFMSGVTVSRDINGYATYTGSIYDSLAGYVSLSTPATVLIGTTDAQFPQLFPTGATGDLVLTGAGGAALHVQPLNVYFAYLGLDTDGDGQIDEGARFDYSTGALDATQPMGYTVEALAEVPSQTTASGAITLDGRYSHVPGAFVSYAWKPLSVPAGSAMRKTATTAEISFTPDISGTYLWQLTITAAGKSAVDFVPVDVAVGSSTAMFGTNITQFKSPGYITGHVGEAVTLDGRSSPYLVNDQPDAYGDIWSLNTPAGSSASLSSTSDPVTSFTPDKPGFYYAVIGGGASYAAMTVIAVDEPYRFAPAATLIQGVTNAESFMNLGTGSFGNEGNGILFGDYEDQPTGSTGHAKWATFRSDGFFSSVYDMSLSTYEPTFASLDLNGDGVTDFAQSYADCDVNFFESSVTGGVFGGYNAQAVTFGSYPLCNTGRLYGAYRAGTIGHNPAVIALCDTGGPTYFPAFQTFLSDGSGNMQAPVFTAIQDLNSSDDEKVYDFQLKDVDGDGEADLVVTVGFGNGSVPTDNYLQIYHGNGDGTFTYTASYLLVGAISVYGSNVPMVIDDFNGDGYLDIAIADNDTLDIFYGDGHGNFSATPDTRTLYSSNVLNYSPTVEYLTEMDINGDGHQDLVIAGAPADAPSGGAVIKLFLSGTGGILGDDLEYPVGNDNYQTLSGAISGDFNGDGLQDLILSNNSLYNQAIMFMPQVPAITSATITSLNPAKVQSQPSMPLTKQHSARVKSIQAVRMHPPNPGE